MSAPTRFCTIWRSSWPVELFITFARMPLTSCAAGTLGTVGGLRLNWTLSPTTSMRLVTESIARIPWSIADCTWEIRSIASPLRLCIWFRRPLMLSEAGPIDPSK